MLEVNKFGASLAVIADEDIQEGFGIYFTGEYGDDWDFGSRGDVPKVKVPQDATQAGSTSYVIMLAPDNREYPVYDPLPRYDWAMRGGFDKAANSPFQATVYLTDPAVTEGAQVVHSGALAVALGPDTIFTVDVTGYVDNAGIKPGAWLSVVDASGGANAGKFELASGVTSFQVLAKDSDGKLTIRIFG